MTTKANKYADEIERFDHLAYTQEDTDALVAELRRLAPMEAQNLKLMDDYFGAKARVKELEDANKTLREVLKNWMPSDVDITDDRHWQWMEDTERLKLLGETK